MSRRKRNSSSEEELHENEKKEIGLRKRQQVKYYEGSSSEDDEKPRRNKKSGKRSTSSDTDDSSFESGDSDRPTLNKKSGKKSTSSDTDDPSFESGDSDFESSYQKKGKSSSVKKKNESMSEYEKQLLEKKNKNLEFLKNIGMDEAKGDLLELKPKKKSQKKVHSRSSNGPKRVSQREKTHINYAEDDVDVVNVELESTELTFEKLLKFKKDYEGFLEDFDEILESDDFVQPPVTYDKDVLKQLSETASVPPGKIHSPTALSWYPSSEHFVLAIGNLTGNVALWNIEDSDYLHKFAVHSKRVSRMQFNPYNTSHLISSSLDGTLLCCDIQKQQFTEVLRIGSSCTYFDFFSPSSYLVSLTNGEVVIVDKRTRGKGDYQHKRYTCHDQVINSIHVHPAEKNYFVTAGRDRKFCIWDLRKLSKLPVIENINYSKSVNSAFFSPLSGKYLLTLSRDIKLCIFDTENMTEGKLKLETGVKCNFGDRESLGSMAVWLPNSDDLFTWLNQESKQMFKIYDRDFSVYETVTDGIKGIRSLNEFHAFKPAIASILQTGAVKISAEEIDT